MESMIIKLKIPGEARFECPTCSKCFSSVKALGGHKWIHMEKKNKRNHQVMELQGDENGGDVSCPVCHQPFASDKSLHGHMRKHPERGWRGMMPPPPLDHEAASGACHLLALAGAQPPCLLQDKGKSVMGENSSLLATTFHHKTPLKSQNNYPCEICGKSFRSYQALGGHKSHHGRLSMEQPEGFAGISGHGQLPEDKGEEGNDDQPAKVVFDFDLNELPKW
ncbi:uncharacterized protein LOC131005247 [Salvia miltiorrhiza]|uniref:uncharacterized protein LOC131005247 n=1 Tax=Salvia miltiorrhiza TaxID=226208 RepID=UPI0025ABCA31|nr:uncharacterized protein LOC131005247 [Salvia miltiorrhiza]